jgi:copper chaperone
MQTTTVTAPDIVCDGCANAIKKAVGAIPGVNKVDVNIESKAVSVTHDEQVSHETLRSVLDKAGFPIVESETTGGYS